MPARELTHPGYARLVAAIRREMTRGLAVVERQRLLTYWAVGRHIHDYLSTPAPRGAIGRFYQKLSRDLQINGRTLQHCEQFYRYFPALKPLPGASWSHYRFLLAVPDAARREAWLRCIQKDRIPADELRLTLLPPPKADPRRQSQLKAPTRGRLYTYRLLRADDIENFDVPWFVDLGFAGRCEAPPSRGVLNNKNLYESLKEPEGYRLRVTQAAAEELFTFRAKVRRVVDGDTLLAAVDQGFSCWTEQKLRLIGVDAPELDTLAGERAKKWVTDELAPCPNVVVKTYKSDQWDRYLADVFYLPGETDLERVAREGLWLNGRLVAAGLAKVWKE